MPVYRYKAVNGAGAMVQGEFDAVQEIAVVEWLRESALMPLKIELAKGGGSGVGAWRPRAGHDRERAVRGSDASA